MGGKRQPPERDGLICAEIHGAAPATPGPETGRGMLFPPQENILETEVTMAARVAVYIFDQGQATVGRPSDVRACWKG